MNEGNSGEPVLKNIQWKLKQQCLKILHLPKYSRHWGHKTDLICKWVKDKVNWFPWNWKWEMTVQPVLLHNITIENRMGRYFLKCVVNSLLPSPLVLANRNCRGSGCLLGLVTLEQVVFFPACLYVCSLCSPDGSDAHREALCQRLCVYIYTWTDRGRVSLLYIHSVKATSCANPLLLDQKMPAK